MISDDFIDLGDRTLRCRRLVPQQSDGLDRTTLVFSMLFPKQTVERPDFQEIVPKYYERFDITLPEDVRAAELQHEGLRSPITAPGRFTAMEQLVLSFDRWWADRMVSN